MTRYRNGCAECTRTHQAALGRESAARGLLRLCLNTPAWVGVVAMYVDEGDFGTGHPLETWRELLGKRAGRSRGLDVYISDLEFLGPFDNTWATARQLLTNLGKL